MEVVVLPCPECGQKIFISNPVQGKSIICGGCGFQLRLEAMSSSNPGEFWTGFAWGGFLMAVASMIGLPYLAGIALERRIRGK